MSLEFYQFVLIINEHPVHTYIPTRSNPYCIDDRPPKIIRCFIILLLLYYETILSSALIYAAKITGYCSLRTGDEGL